MGKQRQPRSCVARTVLDISRLVRSSACCASHLFVESYTVCTMVLRVQTADLDPELDLGCLPYRERFASRARDEVHFEVVHEGKKTEDSEYSKKEKKREVHKGKKTNRREPLQSSSS